MVADSAYPGRRLDLPESGPGSLATFPRRLAALLVDWVACQLIGYAVFDVAWGATGGAAFVPLGIFALENLVLVSTLGSTLGHRLLGLQVHRMAGSPGAAAPGRIQLLGAPGFGRGAVRTALLCLALPALVWDADNRGLHDQAAGTVIVRSR